MCDIISLLNNNVNRKLNPTDLLQLIEKKIKPCSMALFLTSDQEIYTLYRCVYDGIDHTNRLKDSFEFNPYIKDNVFISNSGSDVNGFVTCIDVSNIMTVPIMSESCIIGFLCLYNSNVLFSDDDLIDLSAIITLFQIILEKEVFRLQLNDTYSDNNFMSKDFFLANMTHEIKTPLNGIVGYTQLLLQTNLDSSQKSYVNNMSLCSVQLMRIINDILDFSKLASNKMSVQNDCFSVSELLDELKHSVSQDLRDKKQFLDFKLGCKLPDYIISDKYKLIQVLVNLIHNASKFSSFESVIKISVKPCPYIQNKLIFTVTDKGIGILPHEQCKLFNSFVQIHNSVVKTGSGLGLAISKKIVELLGGDIRVTSEINKGTEFEFTIHHETVSNYNKIVKRDAKVLKGQYVLLVDDNKENRIQIADMLFSWCMKPIVCASALEALRMILGNRYSFKLALLDVCMPGTSGIELAKQIKQEKPLFPLIALSSSLEHVTSPDFDYVLSKPVNKIQLFTSIHTIINNISCNSAYIGKDDDVYDNSGPNSPTSDCKSSIRILVAEDISYNRAVIIEMLQRLGYSNVRSACDGSETIDMLKDNIYDIVLLDIRMPRVDGYGVLEFICKNKIQVEVVAVTASNSNEDKEKCLGYNVTYFISKPIHMQTLKDVMFKVTPS